MKYSNILANNQQHNSSMKNKNQIERLVLVDSSGMLKKPTPLLEEYLQASINPTL